MSGNRKTCTGFKINRSDLVRVAYSELFDFGLGDQYRTAIPCNKSAYTKCMLLLLLFSSHYIYILCVRSKSVHPKTPLG